MPICPVCQTPNPADAVSCERCNSAFGAEHDQTIIIGSGDNGLTIASGGPAASTTSAFSAELIPGEVIADRYEIIQRLGRGGMGVVYKALDRELDRVIALKTIRPDLASNAAALRRFKQETLLARQISHRNVVRIFDLGVAGRLRFITMEFVEGEDLSSRLARLGKFAPKDAAAIMKQICQGLQAAHSEDVIHRDLKPQNILIDARGHIRIMDFGLARSFEETGMTRSGMLVGTPDYISPEQVLGERGDSRSDLFAFGVMFYELLTGELPFAAESMIDAVLRRTRERARPVDLINPALPRRLSQIVTRCLEPDPARRYQSAQEVLNELNAADGQLSLSANLAPGALAPGMMLGSRYRIEAEAGEGGMGKVYRASDLDLNRTVALKIVRPELANDPEAAERLKQEISLASRISHRNVMRIHDLGELDGLLFVSMAWADGEDLGHLLRRSGALPEERILELGQEICAGLGAAHDQGIIHRDLKPANVLLDSAGHACIADFGLARSLQVHSPAPSGDSVPASEAKTQIREINSPVGTPRYMSPEQVQGKPVDHRSDIYSLGLILYEMATGNIPFKDHSVFQTMAQRVSEDPKSPKLLNPAISEKLAATILHCLERAPEQRYANTGELLEDVQRCGEPLTISVPARGTRKVKYAAALALFALVAAGMVIWFMRQRAHATQPPATGKYVAVMPFRAVGPDSNLKYEAEGIGEAISSRLFSLSSVHPISPVAMEQVDLTQPVKTIARKLGANLIVQGTIQGDSDRIAVIANIDNVGTGKRLWSKTFSGVRADLLTLEDEICTELVRALDVTPTAVERERAAVQPTQNVDAYDLYLKGRNILKNRQDDPQTAGAALALFQQACDKDPSFALAWTGVADASLRMYRLKSDTIWADKALLAAREARERNDSLPEVHLALGSVYTATGKNAQAVQEIKKALVLEPNSDSGYVRLGRAYLAIGQSENALAAFKKAVELNPYYWNNHTQLGIAYFQMGRNEDALKEFQRVVELNPGGASGYNNVGAVYSRLSRWKDCIPVFQKAIQLKPSSDEYSNLGTALFFLARYPEAISMFQKAIQMNPNQEVVLGNLADAYRQAGQWEKAQATYDRAIELTYKQLEVNSRDASLLGDLARYYAKKGGTAKALQLVSSARAIDSADNSLMYDEAVIDALAGHTQDALKALDHALKSGYSVGEAQSDPDLKAVRALPGFTDVLQKYRTQK